MGTIPLTSVGTPSMRRPSSSSVASSSTMVGPPCVVSLGSWSTSSLVVLSRLLEICKYAVYGHGLGVSSHHTPGYHTLAVRLPPHCSVKAQTSKPRCTHKLVVT